MMDNPNTYVSVVIPVYNSAEGLRELIDGLAYELDSLERNWEILLVDDGSQDESANVIEQICRDNPAVRGFLLSRNHGQHYATVCGLKQSTGEFVITMDDDMQNPPSEIPRLIQAVENGADIAIGAIQVKKQGAFRRFSSWAINFMLNFLLKKPGNIKLSSFRCLSRKATDLIAEYDGIYPYLPALMFNAVPVRKVTNVPVEHARRKYGRSSYSLRQLFRLASYLVINHSRLLLRVSVVIGVLLAVAAVLMAAFFAVRYWILRSSPVGWTSLAVLVTFFSGVILVSLGIIGEYVGRIIDQSDRMPRYQIYKSYN